MIVSHILGFPRIGAARELKFALERYWRGEIDAGALEETGRRLRARHWALQREAGLDFVTVGDFSFYDHVLDHAALFGMVPERFSWKGDRVDLDTYFRMARGRAPTGDEMAACEMTKWFDTNYHYLVPELGCDQRFRVASNRLFDEVAEARALGHAAKPVLIGPLTLLWLGKGPAGFDRLTLLDTLLPCYRQVLARLAAQGVRWVQIDEPILALDLPSAWRDAFDGVYARLAGLPINLMLSTYFGALEDNLATALALPTAGVHIDVTRAAHELDGWLDRLPEGKVLSLGLVDGRSIWRCDLDAALSMLERVYARIGDRAWLGSSCSLLHVPVDLDTETALNAELRSWLAFARQKLAEIELLKRAHVEGRDAVADALHETRTALAARRVSKRVLDPDVRTRTRAINDDMARRQSPYPLRARKQRERLNLPLLPTTTIGSFPQTLEIRGARAAFKRGALSPAQYADTMRKEIAHAVSAQERLGLDVLVHGEAERNDMVEYFAELLDGYAVTGAGWVQSYGSRCVKPPIIFGDVKRPAPMTVEWTTYAQSLTSRPLKGMLTGPVTLLQWAFVRDDLSRDEVCMQIALAIRAEVTDLERARVAIVQIDEPAFREGMPLRRREREAYLDWAARAFRVASSCVDDATQIHTHMCYSEFNDIIEAIAALDADVITIETARSNMELIDCFREFCYPNEIGPGVFDIHSPVVPGTEDMIEALRKGVSRVPPERLWVNPDCGLKTRGWPEVEEALLRMVRAAASVRDAISGTQVPNV